MRPTPDLARHLEPLARAFVDRDNELRAKEQDLATRVTTAQNLLAAAWTTQEIDRRALEEREAAVAKREAEAKQRFDMLGKYEAEAGKRAHDLAQREEAFAARQRALKQRDDALAARNYALQQREEALNKRDEAISKRESEIEDAVRKQLVEQTAKLGREQQRITDTMMRLKKREDALNDHECKLSDANKQVRTKEHELAEREIGLDTRERKLHALARECEKKIKETDELRDKLAQEREACEKTRQEFIRARNEVDDEYKMRKIAWDASRGELEDKQRALAKRIEEFEQEKARFEAMTVTVALDDDNDEEEEIAVAELVSQDDEEEEEGGEIIEEGSVVPIPTELAEMVINAEAEARNGARKGLRKFSWDQVSRIIKRRTGEVISVAWLREHWAEINAMPRHHVVTRAAVAAAAEKAERAAAAAAADDADYNESDEKTEDMSKAFLPLPRTPAKAATTTPTPRAKSRTPRISTVMFIDINERVAAFEDENESVDWARIADEMATKYGRRIEPEEMYTRWRKTSYRWKRSGIFGHSVGDERPAKRARHV